MNIAKFAAILILVLFCSAFGYVGTLPEIGKTTKPPQNLPPVVKQVPQLQNSTYSSTTNTKDSSSTFKDLDMPPLAPAKFHDLYGKALVKNGKYSSYIKELNDIIPSLEGLREYINGSDQNIQFLSAKVYVFNLYINSLKEKYSKKPEHNYESYKQMLVVDKNITDAANYWFEANQYKKIYQVSNQRNDLDQKIIKARLNKALKSINTALDILNNDTKNGAY